MERNGNVQTSLRGRRDIILLAWRTRENGEISIAPAKAKHAINYPETPSRIIQTFIYPIRSAREITGEAKHSRVSKLIYEKWQWKWKWKAARQANKRYRLRGRRVATWKQRSTNQLTIRLRRVSARSKTAKIGNSKSCNRNRRSRGEYDYRLNVWREQQHQK